jgi:hypothetical protein
MGAQQTLRGIGALVAIGVLALTGCSSSDTPASGSDDPQTPSPSQAPALSEEMLLAAGEMPDWNQAGTWTVVEDADVLKACPLATPESLGATSSLGVTFEYVIPPEEGTTADPDEPPLLGGNTVAQFDDAASAAAAVTAWEEELTGCSAYRNGSFEGGSTWTDSLLAPTSDNAEGAWFDFTAVGSTGARTTVVGFSVYGQDANYEGDPLEQALPTSLERLDQGSG